MGKETRTKFGNCMAACVKNASGSRVKSVAWPHGVVCWCMYPSFENNWMVHMSWWLCIFEKVGVRPFPCPKRCRNENKAPSSPKMTKPTQKKNTSLVYSLNHGKETRTKFGNCMAACVKNGSGSRVKMWHDPWVVCLVHVSIFENQWLVPMIWWMCIFEK